ncbi:MAG: multiheme c-type cytochrome, partial [Thermodesulfobacteriota bacterium]
MKTHWIPAIVFWIFGCGGWAMAAEPAISSATSECLECHASIHPGIVGDWRKSRHSQITPKEALSVKGLGRKVSGDSIPEKVAETVVGCAECHTTRSRSHGDTFEHNGHQVHVVVSPDDCKTCHSREASEFEKNIMSHAYNNLNANPVYQKLELSIIGKRKHKGNRMIIDPPDDSTRAETCYYCHGTTLKVSGTETRDTESAGQLEFPIIEGWPNQGVGRINLDGSKGACSACHTRHAFSIEMARKPYTCKECHVGPDVPAYKVYENSKHGNIFSSKQRHWNFNAVPWIVGKDFTAPTCASCHISLLVNTDGGVIVERTHEMKDRLPWRIFGLIYAHPSPVNPDTTVLRNKDGLPLPTDFTGGMAKTGLIDEKEQNLRRSTLQAACLGCHDTSWVKGHWDRFENTIRQTNSELVPATRLMTEIWNKGWADGNSNPFDEAIERK